MIIGELFPRICSVAANSAKIRRRPKRSFAEICGIFFVITVALCSPSNAIASYAPVQSYIPPSETFEGELLTVLIGVMDPDPGESHTGTIDWGDGSPVEELVNNGYSSPYDATFEGSHVYADDGIYLVTVGIWDNTGLSDHANYAIPVSNVAPTVSAGPDQTVTAGQVVSVLATFNDKGTLDTHTATIDWGDVLGVAAIVESPFGPPGSTTGVDGEAQGAHVYSTAGTYVVNIEVQDDDGAAGSDTLNITVELGATPPTSGTVTSTTTAAEGELLTISVGFSDPNPGESHTGTIDWGDGSPVEALINNGYSSPYDGIFEGNHVYADNGSYEITVGITDNTGLSAYSNHVISVSNVAPTVSAGLDQTVNMGEPLSVLATFNDKGTLDTHAAVINWGDVTEAGVVNEIPFGPPGSTTGIDGTVSGYHVYSTAGTYVVNIEVQDDDGAAGSDTLNIMVEGTELSCEGFYPPFNLPHALKKKVMRAIPLKLKLFDSDGYLLTDAEMCDYCELAPPVVNVEFNGVTYGEMPPDDADLLPIGAANDDNILRYNLLTQDWEYNLGTKQFQAAGLYTVSVKAGDAAYVIDTLGGACTETFERLE